MLIPNFGVGGGGGPTIASGLVVLVVAGDVVGLVPADSLGGATEQVNVDHLIWGQYKVPADVVRMGSTVTFRSDAGADGEQHELTETLVYPADEDSNAHKLSVMMPVGAALIDGDMVGGDCGVGAVVSRECRRRSGRRRAEGRDRGVSRLRENDAIAAFCGHRAALSQRCPL